MTTPEVSHGRGGAGNISVDDTKYVDGEIVRVGDAGSHGDGAFSTGRGGEGNIGDAGKLPTVRADKDLIPEEAQRAAEDADVHTGRGGAGNVQLAPEHKKQKEIEADLAAHVHGSVADKLKAKVIGIFKK
ncbi:hypothetical protein BX600DRAFT_519479 [Xylariales sp. PMI_506]|nr:hypothetical protein BX600DRAFT_519479 [Xylariales sp. PMI_506]